MRAILKEKQGLYENEHPLTFLLFRSSMQQPYSQLANNTNLVNWKVKQKSEDSGARRSTEVVRDM